MFHSKLYEYRGKRGVKGGRLPKYKKHAPISTRDLVPMCKSSTLILM